jgi:hypothetical protein
MTLTLIHTILYSKNYTKQHYNLPHLSPLLITIAYKYGSKHTTSTLVKTTPHAMGGNKRKRASK